jgi:MFS family permease
MPAPTASDAHADGVHRSAFAAPAFRRYFPSAVFSTLGSWLLRFLLGWSAWELTGSSTWVGVTAGLMLAPALVLSPLFGIISDRINPLKGLLITLTAHAVLAGLAALASAADLFGLGVLLLLAALLGVTTSAHTPIRLALVPLLVPRQSLPSAIGYSAITFNTARILGPALGAWLLHASSPTVAYMAAALLMLTALPLLAATRGRRREPGTDAGNGFARQLHEGLAYTRGHAMIRLVFGYTLVNAMLGRTVIELLPALSGAVLGGDSTTLATLTASAGAGSILGGLVVSRQGGGVQRLLGLLGTSLGLGVVLVAGLGASSSITGVALLVGMISLIATIAGTTSQALAQLQVEETYRGRVMSLWTMVAMGAPAAGALVMGALADLMSFSVVLPGFALFAALALVILYRRKPA